MFVTGINISTDKKTYLEKLEAVLAFVHRILAAKPTGIFGGMVKDNKNSETETVLDVIVDGAHRLDEDQVDGILHVLQYLEGEFVHPLKNHRHHFHYHDEIAVDVVWDEDKKCYRQWVDTIISMHGSNTDTNDKKRVEEASAMSFEDIADGILYSWAFGQHDFSSFRKDNIKDYVNVIDIGMLIRDRMLQIVHNSGVARFYIRGAYVKGEWVWDDPDVNREAQSLDEIIFDYLTWK
jgi:predicted nucleotidyltransferase